LSDKKFVYTFVFTKKICGKKEFHPREKVRKKGYTKLARKKMREKNALNLWLYIGIYLVDG
jgi:hypothetical protein